MKALMSYTSSVLEWLGRYVGLLVFGILFVTAMIIRTTMMTGYFEWAEISSVPWYVYVSGGGHPAFDASLAQAFKELYNQANLHVFYNMLCEFWARSDFSDEFCWARRCRYCFPRGSSVQRWQLFLDKTWGLLLPLSPPVRYA